MGVVECRTETETETQITPTLSSPRAACNSCSESTPAPSGLAPTIGMRRSTVRLSAFFVLALLGAPVAMHVVLHDLHAHHDGPQTPR